MKLSALSFLCAGTNIRTECGDTLVENLKVGDLVVTLAGERKPVVRIDHRTIDCRRYLNPQDACPVRIAANAFGKSRPARDLYVSPGHSICAGICGETLIPAAALVNGCTIKQVELDEVTYFHVELDSNGILLVENLPVESCAKSGSHLLEAAPETVDVASYKVFDTGTPVIDAVWTDLHSRALDLGWILDDTVEFHLEVNGRRIEPIVRGSTARFSLPADAKDAWLISPSACPRHTFGTQDRRDLGLYIASLRIEDGLLAPRDIALDHPLLREGFHDIEDGGRRWTTGRACLPASLWKGCEDGFFLSIVLAGRPVPRWRSPLRERPYGVVIERPSNGTIEEHIPTIAGFVQSSDPLPALTLFFDGIEQTWVHTYYSSDPNAHWDRRFTTHWAFRWEAGMSERHATFKICAGNSHEIYSRQFSVKFRRSLLTRPNALIYFIHVEKTAGTSLRTMIEKQNKINVLPVYNGKEFVPEASVRQFSRNALRDTDLVYGHFPYGLHSQFARPFRYVSILRRPEEFVKSYYLYVKYKSPTTDFDHCLNINEALEKSKVLSDNRFTRYFSGNFDSPSVSETDYRAAIANIEEDFEFIGISEDTETFHRAFCKLIKVKYHPTVENVTPVTPETTRIDLAGLREILKEKLEWDYKLYDFVRDRWRQFRTNTRY